MLFIAAAFVFSLFYNSPIYAGVTQQDPAVAGHRLDHYQFFAYTQTQSGYGTSTTGTAVSTNIRPYFDSNGRLDNGAFVVAGAEAATLIFSRSATSGPNAGLTTFDFEVSDNGTDWYAYDRLLGTNTGATTTANYVISAATSTTVVNVDLSDKAIYAIRCIIANTTDGTGTCRATARY